MFCDEFYDFEESCLDDTYRELCQELPIEAIPKRLCSSFNSDIGQTGIAVQVMDGLHIHTMHDSLDGGILPIHVIVGMDKFQFFCEVHHLTSLGYKRYTSEIAFDRSGKLEEIPDCIFQVENNLKQLYPDHVEELTDIFIQLMIEHLDLQEGHHDREECLQFVMNQYKQAKAQRMLAH